MLKTSIRFGKQSFVFIVLGYLSVLPNINYTRIYKFFLTTCRKGLSDLDETYVVYMTVQILIFQNCLFYWGSNLEFWKNFYFLQFRYLGF